MPYEFPMMPRKLAIVGTMMVILAGCGGSGGSSVFPPITPPPKPPVTPPNNASFSELSSLAQTLYAEITPLQPTTNMPTTGTATYVGAVSYVRQGAVPDDIPADKVADYVVANPTMMSNANLTANFGAKTINGTLGNFVDSTTGPWQGEMAVSNGKIAGNTFVGDLSGSIGLAGAQKPTTGTIDGGFGGSGAQYVAGTVDLTVGLPGTSPVLGGVLVGKK